MPAIRICLSLALVIALGGALKAASQPLIEVEVGEKKLQGRVAAHGKSQFWLMGQDGRLERVANDDVKKFHQVSPQFKSWSASIIADQLRRELGKSFDVISSRHYVVCAVGEAKARAYGDILEGLFRSFQSYFSIRGFKVDEPEFPLVAIVFPDKEFYARYAEADGMSVTKALAYYKGRSNRIALHEDAAKAAAQQSRVGPPRGLRGPFSQEGSELIPFRLPLTAAGDSLAWGTVDGAFQNTMIHEATHQAAFNSGLHSRIGGNPKWVVEGLATVFEAPGIRNSSANAGVKTRINSDRFIRFGNYARSRRRPRSLESFISSDDSFEGDIHDAYAEAWAFSFFLIETRPRPYAEYLRTIAARNHVYVYSPEKRVADFKRIVSQELPHLESEFLKFMGGIK